MGVVGFSCRSCDFGCLQLWQVAVLDALHFWLNPDLNRAFLRSAMSHTLLSELGLSLLTLFAPQVELAQSEYQLPRLTRMWSHLERQSGSGQVGHGVAQRFDKNCTLAVPA